MKPEEKRGQRKQRTTLEQNAKQLVKDGFPETGKKVAAHVGQMRRGGRAAHFATRAASTHRIEVNGKPYLVTFSRPLSDYELQRISTLQHAGAVQTVDEVRRQLEGALAILNAQHPSDLTVLDVREAE